MPSGPKVLLTIRDTGIGMDEEILSHIFDPFFTTKAKGKGTGLGLSTVYGIIKQSDAAIQVSSAKGKGTTFQIYFNSVEADEAEIREVKSELHNLSGRETILVAEDEEAVREYVGVVLNKYGYNVILTSTGMEALDILRNETGKIDLLITDVIMPGLSGKDLVDKILQYNPRLKYLYISGYTEDVIGQHGILDEQINIIQKPFTHRAFLEKIRSIIG
jgi:CheY-like chemotaxis protein